MAAIDFILFDEYQHLGEGARWIAVGWMFALGAIFGSFMNVVAYRLPRGMNLSYPGSRCPTCEHPIRWHDNVPIVSWLVLRGHCRDCHAPISARYPLVEALVAVVSAALAWIAARDALAANPDMPVDLAALASVYAFRMLLVCTLICAALMEFDGQDVPPRMLQVVLVLGFALGCAWPGLRLDRVAGEDRWHGIVAGVSGLLTAGLLGALAWPGFVAAGKKRAVSTALVRVGELALVGVFLGARAVAVVTVVALALDCVVHVVARIWPTTARIDWSSVLAATTFLYIVAWPEVVTRWPRGREPSEMMLLVACGLIVAALAITLRQVRSRSSALQPF